MTSNIDTTRINANFPVAGQNNDSQGFRDNFANIKVALNFAKSEITNLQNTGLRSGPIGNEIVDNRMNWTLLTSPQLKAPSITFVDLGLKAGQLVVDYSSGTVQKITVVSNIELDFRGFPPAGQYGSLILWFSVSSTSYRVLLPLTMKYGLNNNQQIVNNQIQFPDVGDFLVEFASTDNGSSYWLIDFANLGGSGGGGGNGATGATGPRGATGMGATGPAGQFGGISVEYRFRNSIADADPGLGLLSFDSTDLSAATEMYIDKQDVNGVVVADFLRTIDDSTNPIKGHFRLGDKTDVTKFAMFTIGGMVEHDAYFSILCNRVSGIQSFSNLENVVLTFARTGDVGATGSTGPQGATGLDGKFAGYGATGSTGPRGFTGPQGIQGATGPQGIQGIPGQIGPMGATGIGYAGSRGLGDTGATGPGGGRFVIVGSCAGNIEDANPFTIGNSDNIILAEAAIIISLSVNLMLAVTQAAEFAVTRNGQVTSGRVTVPIGDSSAAINELSVNFAAGDTVSFVALSGEGGGGVTIASWFMNGGAVGYTGSRGLSGQVAYAGATGATGIRGATGPIGATGLSGATGADGLGEWYNFTAGIRSPGPRTFSSPNLSGFHAFNSTDFPGPYFIGMGLSNDNPATNAQLIMNWGSAEEAPTGIYFRTNDVIGDNAAWSDWRRILVDGGLVTPSAGNGNSYGIKFPNNPGGGSGDSAWIRYYATTTDKTILEIGVANDGQDPGRDNINIVTPLGSGVGINTADPKAGLDVAGPVYASGFYWTSNSNPYTTGLSSYDIPCFVVGRPSANQIINRVLTTKSFSIPGNCVGSAAVTNVNSTSTVIIEIIKKNPVSGSSTIGTITFENNSNIGTFRTFSGSNTFTQFEELILKMPGSQDSSLSDIAITIAASYN